MDEYDPMRMLRRQIFAAVLPFLESKTVNEELTVEALKGCIDFFVGGAHQSIVRDFCMAKMQVAHQRMR